ncbi:MAG: glycosyltransferase [Fimbriimonadaceae bacterium]
MSGGPIEGIKQLAPALESAGATVSLVCGDEPDASWVADFPFKIHAVGPAYGKYGYAPDLVDWLLRHAANYDRIIIDGVWQYHGFAAHSVLRKLGLGYFTFTHGMLDPWFQRRYPLKHLKKLAYWRLAEYPVLRDANAVLFHCEEEARLARESFRPNEWHPRIVSCGTAGSTANPGPERHAFLARFEQLATTRNILFLGRITPKKGVDMLIRAFADICHRDANLRLVLAGPIDTAFRNQLARLAADSRLGGRVVWTGMLQGAEKWGAFRAAEVFILPSHQENFGLSVAEALSCGVPVLISDKVNIWREIVADCAGLAESDTLEGTVRLLNRWLDLGQAASAAMASAARRSYCSRYDVNQVARQLLAVLEQAPCDAGVAL